MSDPKYASLPGIDRSQPDVYETSDLPEDDQALPVSLPVSQDEHTSDSIEKLTLSANQAFQQFKGKSIEIGNTDFSDQIGGTGKIGYHIPRSEYEILGGAAHVKETPEQRFQRLQHEIRELAEDVNLIKENVKLNSGDVAQAVAMTRQVEYLQHQMNELNLDQQLGGSVEINATDPQGALLRRLLMEIDGFEASGSHPTTVDKNKAVDDDHVTYQLFHRPEQAKFTKNARVAELEQRLERLEAVLGNKPDKITSLNSDLGTKSLLTAVSTLAARTKLLDPAHLDQIDSRLVALHEHLNQAAQKKDDLERSGKLSKVNELYDLVSKWDPVLDSFPVVVDRLLSLHQLHDQALNFSQNLIHLETAQNEITSLLKSHGDLLKQSESTLLHNLSAVQANCESLSKRVNALNK